MEKEKEVHRTVDQLTKQELIGLVKQQEFMEASNAEFSISSIEDLKNNFGMSGTRTLLLDMMLQFSSNSGNGVEDEEIHHMMNIFDIFNA